MDDKRVLRESVLRRRATRTTAERVAAGHDLAEHGRPLADGCRVVAAYAAVGAEPPTRPLLEGFLAAGLRVLLPVVVSRALRWGELTGWSALVESGLGLLEPDGVTDAATEAAARAELVLVPALAVDRAGHRLGRGGGYYDRWLAAGANGRLVAVIYDDELVDRVPYEPHDRTVDAVLTPAGVVRLGQ